MATQQLLTGPYFLVTLLNLLGPVTDLPSTCKVQGDLSQPTPWAANWPSFWEDANSLGFLECCAMVPVGAGCTQNAISSWKFSFDHKTRFFQRTFLVQWSRWFFLYQFGTGERNFCTAMYQYIRPNKATPLQSVCVVNGTEFFDGWVWVIYLFIPENMIDFSPSMTKKGIFLAV